MGGQVAVEGESLRAQLGENVGRRESNDCFAPFTPEQAEWLKGEATLQERVPSSLLERRYDAGLGDSRPGLKSLITLCGLYELRNQVKPVGRVLVKVYHAQNVNQSQYASILVASH